MSIKIRYRTRRKQLKAVPVIKRFNPFLKIIFLALFLILADFKGFAQINVTSADTLKKQQNTSSFKDKKDKTEETKEKNQKNAAVKQVKGARPDFSKSRGARPTYIERQSGSGIPRGIGRPGGAMKPGKR